MNPQPKHKTQNSDSSKRSVQFFSMLRSVEFLSILFVLMSGIYFALLVLNEHTEEYIVQNTLPSRAISFSSPIPYPQLKNTLGVNTVTDPAQPEDPLLSAHAAIIMDDASKVVLFGKNESIRFSMASTTKIMTALTALEYFNEQDILTVKSTDVEGSVIGLPLGEKMYFNDLLYVMLLPSANDAAVAIAQNYPGGEAAFIEKMNENAAKWHLRSTHFSDSSGLDDAGDYTTVLDLARLSSIAMKNDTVAHIVGTQYKTVTDVTKTRTYVLNNLNKLLSLRHIKGIKTGYTEEAGGVLTTAVTVGNPEDNHQVITVVMKSKDRFADTESLLAYIDKRIFYTDVTRE